MSYLDIAFLGIIVIGALLGLLFGCYKSLISFAGWLIAVLLAFFITSPIVGALLDINKIKMFVAGNGQGWSLFKWVYGTLPDVTSGFWSKLFKSLINISQTVADSGKGDIQTNVSLLIANGIFSAIVFMALVVVIRALLLLLTMFLNALAKDKMKGTSNRVFGMLVGLVKGFSCSIIFMIILTFTMGLGIMAPVRSQLDKSVITAPIYTQVSNVTDKIMTGGQKRLEYLLHAGGFDRDQAASPEEIDHNKYVGQYTGKKKQGDDEYEWTLTLNADKTFKLVYALGSEGKEWDSGTYKIVRNGGKNILMLDFKLQNDGECEIGDDYVYFKDMDLRMIKKPIEAGTYTGTNTQGDDEYEWTLTLNADKTFKLVYEFNGEEKEWDNGTYKIELNGETKILILDFKEKDDGECEIGDDYIYIEDMDLRLTKQ